MATVIKWFFTAIVAGLAWLVTGYAMEYFKPYRKNRHRTGETQTGY